MRGFQPFVILFVWYTPGFLVARAMARRGHDPVPWVLAAWIGGALCVVAAVVWSRLEHRRDANTVPDTRVPLSRR